MPLSRTMRLDVSIRPPRISPVATDAMMNASTTSRGRRSPTFLSSQRPRRIPNQMNRVGSTAANSAASIPQPAPASPSA